MGRETQLASEDQLSVLYSTLHVCADTLKSTATDIKRKVSDMNSPDFKNAMMKGGNGDKACEALDTIAKNQDFLAAKAEQFYKFGNKKLSEMEELGQDSHGLGESQSLAERAKGSVQ